MLECEVCGTSNAETARVCGNCGVALHIPRARLHLDRAEGLASDGKYDAAEQALGRADRELVQLGPQHHASRQLQARSLYIQGLANYGRGKMEQARADLQQAVQQLEPAGDLAVLAHALRVLGNTDYLQGRIDSAADYYRRSVAAAEQAQAYGLAASATANLGNIAVVRNDQVEAAALHRQGLAYAELDGCADALGIAYHSIMWFYINSAPFDQALDYANRAMQIQTKIGNPKRRALVLADIGLIYTRWGDYLRAESCLTEAAEIANQVDDNTLIALTNAYLTKLLRYKGDDEGWLTAAARGFHNLDASLSIRLDCGEQLALYYAYHRDAAHARPLLDWTQQRAVRQELQGGQPMLERMQAYIHFALGDYAKADAQFHHSLTHDNLSPYEQATAWEEYARLALLYAPDDAAMQTQAQEAIAKARALYTRVGLTTRAAELDTLASE